MKLMCKPIFKYFFIEASLHLWDYASLRLTLKNDNLIFTNFINSMDTIIIQLNSSYKYLM